MKNIVVVLLLLCGTPSFAQRELFKTDKRYTRQDSLRGSITPERAWWDLLYYDMYVSVKPDSKFISGKNIVKYRVLNGNQVMQIDLQSPMKITKVVQNGSELKITDEGIAHFVQLQEHQAVDEEKELEIHFEGYPHEAVKAPWDGGYSWKKDNNGKHFVATSNQGIGASLWWPCKDHMYDEPDNGVTLRINVPGDLVGVGNGRLQRVKKEEDKTKTYIWQVVNPINNYGVNVNVGDYVTFSDKHDGEKGQLDMDYWVLRYNLEKAKVHFKDANRTMEAFEHWFGPYPFYEDSYKLVEVPYLGMEHQSSVTYGNGYVLGYRGKDLSGTGWGLKWDYLIVHETGHEWFANNITFKDAADMWIHESFTMYSESLFIEYFYGKEAGAAYSRGLRMSTLNDTPIIGDYEVNKEGSKDVYNKGNNMLHTLRQINDDDDEWRSMLRGLNKEFYHQTVTSDQIETYIEQRLGLNLDGFFDQYLRDARIPTFEYFQQNNKLTYRWTNCVPNFNMPIKIYVDGNEFWLTPTNQRQQSDVADEAQVEVDKEFYVYTFDTKGGE